MTQDNSILMRSAAHAMSIGDFARLGSENLAYITELPKSEAREFAMTMGVDIGDARLYALHSGDGTRMAITDDRGEALMNALESGFIPVTLH